MSAEGPDYHAIVRDFAKEAGGLGVQIVDVAETVEQIGREFGSQIALLGEVQQGMRTLAGSNG